MLQADGAKTTHEAHRFVMNEHTDSAKISVNIKKTNKKKIDMFYIAMGIKPKQVLLLLLEAPSHYKGERGGGFSTAFILY